MKTTPTYRWLWWFQASHDCDGFGNAVAAKGFENIADTLTNTLKR